MALGDLVLEETGQVTGIRVLSTDASGTKLEVSPDHRNDSRRGRIHLVDVYPVD